MLFTIVRRYSFIFVIPTFILILSVLLKLAAGPFWQYSDPCYIYLFNALNMVKGVAPTHIDHPGTPLQLLILFIIWFVNIGHSTQEVLNKVLTNPEFYLSLTYILLTLLSFITSVCLAFYIYNKTQDKIAVLLTQLPGLSFLILPSFTSSTHTIIPIIANVTAEPVLISIINLFNLSFLMLFFAKTSRKEIQAALLSGFICGLGLATKLTFLPLLILPLIVISWRIKPLFMIIASLSFILWTLPIIHKYPLLWGWGVAILTHTGYDGRGSQGIVDWHIFLLHLFRNILASYWFYFLPAVGIFIYSSKQLIKDSSNRRARFLWAVTLGVLLQIIVVAKHFTFHYLVPSIGLCGSVFFLFYIDKIDQNKPLKQLVTIFIFLFIVLNITQAMIYRTHLTTTTKALTGFHDKIYSKYPNCTIIASESNTVSLYLNQDYALFFGNNNSGHVESEELSQLYPHHFYFNPEGFDSSVYGYGIWDSKKRVFADDILTSCPCVILLSGAGFPQTPYETSIIEKSEYANAYLLLSSTEKQAVALFSLATETFKKGDYPQAFGLALKSRDLNFQPKGEVDYLLAMIYSHLQQK